MRPRTSGSCATVAFRTADLILHDAPEAAEQDAPEGASGGEDLPASDAGATSNAAIGFGEPISLDEARSRLGVVLLPSQLSRPYGI